MFANVPPGAVRINSSLLMLTGKYVDADGIVYDPDGYVNEAATAAYAREVAMGRVASPYYDYTTPEAMRETKQDSIQQRSEYEASAAYWDSMFDNVVTTATEIPGRVVDAAQEVVSYAMPVAKIALAVGVGYLALKAFQAIPGTNERIREYRGRAARAVARRIEGAA